MVAALKRRFAFWAVALIVVAAWACYATSLSTPFVFDGVQHLRDNPTIRRVWPAWEWLSFAQTRPVAYFTFALNYAMHGNDVFGYHVVNVAIHTAAALLLFDLIRRTLRLPRCSDALRRYADSAALTVALLWVVHPLGTQSVTYIYQRLESLTSLFCLASLWAFVRANEPASKPRRSQRGTSTNRWKIASVAACLPALLTKESAAGLPLVILWYDRVFLADSWRAIAARKRYYAALGVSFCVLAIMAYANATQYAKAGLLVVRGVSPLDYALSQPGVLLHYVRLTFWPSGQCIDYSWPVAHDAASIVPPLLMVSVALAITIWGLAKARPWSFPLGAFFLLLAPTSSIVPIADLAFEHRMYLPSACVVAGAVCGAIEIGCRWSRELGESRRRTIGYGAALVVAIVATALATATVRRNRVYESEFALWTDVVAKAPKNARGHASLAGQLMARGDREAALVHYRRAVELAPDYTIALLNLATMAADAGRFDEAEELLARAMQSNPGYTKTLHSYGMVRAAQGRVVEAERYFLEALEADPYNWAAMNQLGLLYYESEQFDRAADYFLRSSDIAPHEAPPVANYGVCLCRAGRYSEALPVFRQAIELDREHVDAWANLGSALGHAGREEEAVRVLREATAMFPDHAGCRLNFANALVRRGRHTEAIEQYRAVLTIEPQNRQAAENLAAALADFGVVATEQVE